MKIQRLLICAFLLPVALAAEAARFGELPLAFEPNVGQTDPRVRFLSRGAESILFLAGTEAVLSLRRAEGASVLRLRLDGGLPGTAEALEPLPGVSHYYLGQDPARWRTGVPQYGRVKLSEVSPGIDQVWYGRDRHLEFDFVVAPGADPGAIALSLQGADRLELAPSGDLLLHVDGGVLTFRRPFSYQEVDGERREVASRYRLEGGRVGFELGGWDRSRPLVIDPLLVWSSFLGGEARDNLFAVAVDGTGSLIATGTTQSAAFPGGGEAERRDSAVFVSRVNPEGTALVFSAILDGAKTDTALAAAVDGQGAIYVAGQTLSNDFPLFRALQPEFNPGFSPTTFKVDAFVTKLTSSGAFAYSTYLGGRDWDSAEGIAVDSFRRAHVAGWSYSGNYPVRNEFQGDAALSGSNATLTVLSPDGQGLVYSTLLRGSALDGAEAVAVDAAGNSYVAGSTESTNFPVKGAGGAAPFQAANRGGLDAFVAKIDPSAAGAASLVYSTCLGGPGTDEAFGVDVDAAGLAHVTGITGSAQFPLVSPPGRPVLDGTNTVNEAFVTRLNAQGSGLLFSTFLGGSGGEVGRAIAVDGAGAVYVTGETTSANFPVANAFQGASRGGNDAFVAKIDPATATLLWSSYLGGTDEDLGRSLVLDFRGNVYLGGETFSGTTFPRVGAFQGTFGGGGDAFLARIESTPPDTIGVYRPSEGRFFLRNANGSGPSDHVVTPGQPGDLPVAGNWLGAGDRPGVFRAGTFILKRFTNDLLCCDISFSFGQAGDLPVAGDWNGDGIDTIGVFRDGLFLLRNRNVAGPTDLSFSFGTAGDIPVAGDWDGDGVDGIGVFRPSTGEFFLRNGFSGPVELAFVFGQPGDEPVAGDWDGDGRESVGVFRDGRFLLRNSLSAGPETLNFGFGTAGDLPVAGDWNGKP